MATSIPSTLVNTADPRQDVHVERMHDPNLLRYRIAEALLPTESQGLAVLELGGGIAELSRRMMRRGMEVTFVDLSEQNIRKARALGLEAHRLDLNSGLAEFPEKRFDCVVILEVIEHIVAAEALLSEISRVLKPGGSVVLSTPNFAFLPNRLRILFGRLSIDEGYHYRFFTVKSLRRQLADAGISVERTAHTSPAVGLNFFWNRLLGRPRIHVGVPDWLASLFAHTLIVKGRRV
jgi:methionine biosynthesis protein MetW